MFEMNPLKKNAAKTADAYNTQPTSANAPEPTIKAPGHGRPGSIATIGPSIFIKGDLSGEEDLLIQGNVDGTINLKQNNLTIGQEGQVNANIYAHSITVEGSLKGDVFGEDKVIIKKTGSVHGNITAPRVSLEDGAKFKGSMDMDYKRAESAAPRSEASTASVVKLDKTMGGEKTSFESKGAVK